MARSVLDSLVPSHWRRRAFRSGLTAAGCGIGLYVSGARLPAGCHSAVDALSQTAFAAHGAHAPASASTKGSRVAPHSLGAVSSQAGSWPCCSTALTASSLLAGGAVSGRRRRRATALRRGAAAGSDASGSSNDDSSKSPATPSPAAKGADKGNPLVAWWNSQPVDLQEDIKVFFQSLTFALFIRFVFVEPRFIPSLSMYPTFDVGDQLAVDKISRNWRPYARRDVIVFNPPPAFSVAVGGDRSGEALIKRIVALEGDTVEVKNGGQLYLNGEPQDEPFTNANARYTFGPVVVPKGCVFVLGDNRNASVDGHIWGFLPKENIIGRATLKFWPPWRAGGVENSPP